MNMTAQLASRTTKVVPRLLTLAGFLLSAASCTPKTTQRLVEDPAGTAVEYGAPRDVTYSTDIVASKQILSLYVYQSARCDVIPVTIMQRYRETLRNDKVVQRAPVTKTQVAGKPKGTIPCDQTYARNIEVFLDAGGNRVSLGQTDAQGRVEGNLVGLLATAGYANSPKQAKFLIRPRGKPLFEAGTIELHELAQYETRVTELLAELEAILAKGEAGQSAADVTKSYEIYWQLVSIADGDPRVEAIGRRFWELWYGRKQVEATQRMEKNLEALGRAKDTLKVMGDAAIPLYVQAAVNSGYLDARALEWSSLRLIRALRGAPTVCTSGFAFSRLGSYGWPADAQVAAQYVNYAYGPNPGFIATACR